MTSLKDQRVLVIGGSCGVGLCHRRGGSRRRRPSHHCLPLTR